MTDIAKIAAMPNDEQIVEAMARAAFERRHQGARNCYAWDDFWEENEYQRHHYMNEHQAALTAQREMGLVLISAERLAALETEIRLLSEQLDAANAALNVAAQDSQKSTDAATDNNRLSDKEGMVLVPVEPTARMVARDYWRRVDEALKQGEIS
jgi:hypothetical protein